MKKHEKHARVEDLSKQELAGFWIRLAAFVIDSLVLILISVITAIVFMVFVRITKLSFEIETTASFVGFLINAGYYVFMTYRYGATFGKRFFGLKVQSCDDEKLDIGIVLVREVAGKFLSAMFFGLGYVWIFFDKKKQGLHDKLAKTVVLIEEKERAIKWRISIVISVFIVFSVLFLVWSVSSALDEEFQAETERSNAILVVGKSLVSAKICVSEGNKLTNPENKQTGGGDICSEEIGLVWGKLNSGYGYGEINEEYIYIEKDGVAEIKCEIASGECSLE